MVLTSGWDAFWSQVSSAFKDAWADITNFWLGTEENTPYIANFIFALAVLVVGIILIKLFIKLLTKIFKLDKKIFKENSVKSFIISTIKIVLYFALVLIFLAILRVELSGFAQIFSSAILAIGLSLQDVISNFASGIIILTSRPFVTGDYIKIENEGVEGSVKDVRFLVTTLEDPKPVCYVAAFEASDIKLSLRCYVPNILYWDVFFEMNEKVLIEFNKLGIQIPFNRLVIQTLDEDGKVVINKRKGEKRL